LVVCPERHRALPEGFQVRLPGLAADGKLGGVEELDVQIDGEAAVGIPEILGAEGGVGIAEVDQDASRAGMIAGSHQEVDILHRPARRIRIQAVGERNSLEMDRRDSLLQERIADLCEGSFYSRATQGRAVEGRLQLFPQFRRNFQPAFPCEPVSQGPQPVAPEEWGHDCPIDRGVAADGAVERNSHPRKEEA
jgi:hypothetical protein